MGGVTPTTITFSVSSSTSRLATRTTTDRRNSRRILQFTELPCKIEYSRKKVMTEKIFDLI